MKPRVAVLFSGQMRINTLNPYLYFKDDTVILDSLATCFLNDEFKSKYDYDVFFSTDVIDISKTKEVFGENLKNIHIIETNFYLEPIEDAILSYGYYHDKYLRTDFKGCDNHINGLYQYYRTYCAYILAKYHEKKTNIKYDYYVKIRPDSRLVQDMNILFTILETTNKQIIMEHDHLYILKSSFQEIFKMIDYFGFFSNYVTDMKIFNHLNKEPCQSIDHLYKFAPERQFMEYVLYIVVNNNLNFEDAILGIIYPSLQLIYRGNGSYAYVDYHPETWIPYQKIEYIKP